MPGLWATIQVIGDVRAGPLVETLHVPPLADEFHRSNTTMRLLIETVEVDGRASLDSKVLESRYTVDLLADAKP
jgi:hypothetical protein